MKELIKIIALQSELIAIQTQYAGAQWALLQAQRDLEAFTVATDGASDEALDDEKSELEQIFVKADERCADLMKRTEKILHTIQGMAEG